jgi:hypothetical protein
MTHAHEISDAERAHVSRFWQGRKQEEFVWTLGPIGQRMPQFRVRRVAPKIRSDPWIYLTIGAWEATPGDRHGLEFLLLSPTEDPLHVELLAMVTNLHADPRYRLDVNRTINIGRPWVDGSVADYLLVTLPYPFGPALEHLETDDKHIRFLWLVPVTKSEADLVQIKGIEAFEQLLEQSQTDVVDPTRPALV